MKMSERTNIYYWKCDREDAFHGTSDYKKDQTQLTEALDCALKERFGGAVSGVAPAAGQGNHRTFTAFLDGNRVFVRVEDGEEGDGYFAVEAAVTKRVASLGVPVPETIAYDISRKSVSFAWQVIPFIDAPDLNMHFKAGTLDWTSIAPAVGRAIATWQGVSASGFGPFNIEHAASGALVALHPTQEAYYRLNLDRHLGILSDSGFLSESDVARIRRAVDLNIAFIHTPGVLVHKDTALWNMLGSPDRIAAFIDWDDTIIGDAMDDVSLMACFHGPDVISRFLAGYMEVRPLPSHAAPRFWLDLLRNMLFKAVIRVGAGYFRHDASFFLVSGGEESLEETTRRKINAALEGLERGLGLP